MPTLYVENVPDDLYAALRERARRQHRSMAAEVLSLLEESLPTARELRTRRELLRKLEQMRSKKSRSARSFPSTEEMQRQDRERCSGAMPAEKSSFSCLTSSGQSWQICFGRPYGRDVARKYDSVTGPDRFGAGHRNRFRPNCL